MSDLHSRVRDGLSNLKFDSAERDEVIDEIASHLELASADIISAGIALAEAQTQVLSTVGDWTQLRCEIEKSRQDTVKDRMKKMWLPAFVTGFIAFAAQGTIAHLVAEFLSFAAQGIVPRLYLAPRIIQFREAYLQLNLPWLIFLIFCGAFGAYWSRSMGGRLRERLVSALAPVLVMGTLFLFALITDVVFQVFVDHQFSLRRMAFGFAVWIVWMVILPAMPLLLGSAWFLRGSSTKVESAGLVDSFSN
jgi:hypothetical protein